MEARGFMQNRRVKCISCGSELPEDIVLIGDQYPSAVYLADGDMPATLHRSSLNVTRCVDPSCTLVQLSNEYDLQYVFDHYPYESGITATMKDILSDVAKDCRDVVCLKPDDVVLDIGGNDGTMLDLFNMQLKARVNIDAAAGVTQTVTDDNYHYRRSRFDAKVYQSIGLPNPKLITSVAMFYQVENPIQFCRDVTTIMDDDSVWVLQMTYVGTMLENNILDNIVHEHVAYYSLHSIEALLKTVGLSIAEARIVDSYGGSLRLFIVKNPALFPKNHWRKDYASVVSYEEKHRTNTFEALYAFNSRSQLIRKCINGIIEHLVEEQGPIWGFGASTKGNMLLQFLGADVHKISCILDNSSKKIGTKTTGTLVPIVDEAAELSKAPKYLIVLPYYYTDAFVEIIRKKMKRGGEIHLLIPLPYPRFITLRKD